MARRTIAILVAVAALALAPAAGAAVSFHSGDGIQVASIKQLDSRLIALSVKTAALPGPSNVRILLPGGYAQHPRWASAGRGFWRFARPVCLRCGASHAETLPRGRAIDA
jgi:hypothetical protein